MTENSLKIVKENYYNKNYKNVILAIKNTTFFEVLLPSGAQKYGIIDDLNPDSNGMITAPDVPGLGANIDFDLIKSKSFETLQ